MITLISFVDDSTGSTIYLNLDSISQVIDRNVPAGYIPDESGDAMPDPALGQKRQLVVVLKGCRDPHSVFATNDKYFLDQPADIEDFLKRLTEINGPR